MHGWVCRVESVLHQMLAAKLLVCAKNQPCAAQMTQPVMQGWVRRTAPVPHQRWLQNCRCAQGWVCAAPAAAASPTLGFSPPQHHAATHMLSPSVRPSPCLPLHPHAVTAAATAADGCQLWMVQPDKGGPSSGAANLPSHSIPWTGFAAPHVGAETAAGYVTPGPGIGLGLTSVGPLNAGAATQHQLQADHQAQCNPTNKSNSNKNQSNSNNKNKRTRQEAQQQQQQQQQHSKQPQPQQQPAPLAQANGCVSEGGAGSEGLHAGEGVEGKRASRSARRKAAKRRLRRLGVLPYTP
eukprot:1157012-Pelagomonas_calceolata.AAC.9